MSTKDYRIRLAKGLKKYSRLGLFNKKLDEYDRVRRMKLFARDRAEFYDLVAVSDMLKVLSALGREAELAAFVSLYMPKRAMASTRKGDISSRATRTAIKNHCDVRTVYRYSASVTELYAKIREEYK